MDVKRTGFQNADTRLLESQEPTSIVNIPRNQREFVYNAQFIVRIMGATHGFIYTEFPACDRRREETLEDSDAAKCGWHSSVDILR